MKLKIRSFGDGLTSRIHKIVASRFTSEGHRNSNLKRRIPQRLKVSSEVVFVHHFGTLYHYLCEVINELTEYGTKELY